MRATIFDSLKKNGYYKLIRNGRTLGKPEITYAKFIGRLPLYREGHEEKDILGIFEIISSKQGIYSAFPDLIMYLTENLSHDGITLEEISEDDMKVEVL
jgi:hypothetical protein